MLDHIPDILYSFVQLVLPASPCEFFYAPCDILVASALSRPTPKKETPIILVPPSTLVTLLIYFQEYNADRRETAFFLIVLPPVERWLPVEALCAGLGGNGSGSLLEAEGRELILFGGKVGNAQPPACSTFFSSQSLLIKDGSSDCTREAVANICRFSKPLTFYFVCVCSCCSPLSAPVLFIEHKTILAFSTFATQTASE